MSGIFDIAVVWAFIIAFAVFVYVMLDGFDLGLGMLFPLFPNKADRDVAMNSVAPVWDGNETWLVLGGGGLFAAFPLAYAVLMPALYTPMIAMLLGLVFRGVAFEFRWRTTRERNRWDIAFAGGSLVATVMKTEGELREQAYRLSWWLLFAMLGAIGAVSLATPFLDMEYAQRWFAWPNIVLTAPVPIAVAGVALLLLRSLASKQDYRPFFLSLALFALSYAGLGISIWPYIVPRSITIWQAASPQSSQIFMLVGVAVLVPIILTYTSWNYWVFRGKVRAGSGYH